LVNLIDSQQATSYSCTGVKDTMLDNTPFEIDATVSVD
jgi:hypothetical protein